MLFSYFPIRVEKKKCIKYVLGTRDMFKTVRYEKYSSKTSEQNDFLRFQFPNFNLKAKPHILNLF